MKRFLVLWLLMASCLSGLAKGQVVCQNKNHMLNQLSKAGATIYLMPRENGEFCQPEWSSSRTCCDPSTAGSIMYTKTQKNLHGVQEMIQEIESLPAAIHSFHLAALKSPAMTAAAKLACQQKYDALATHIYWQKSAFRSSQYQCMNRLNQITRASTCNICSGRSEEFFNGDKIVIKESLCRSVIGDCDKAWRGVIYVLSLLQTYTTEVKKSYNGQLPQEHFDSLEALSKSHNLAEHFRRCPEMSTCDTSTVTDICQHMISILAPSYADTIGLQMKKTTDTLAGKLLQAVRNIVAGAAKAVVNTVSNVGGKIGKFFNQRQKAYSPSGNTPLSHQQHQTWVLSARDDSKHLLNGEDGRVLQGSNSNGCNPEIFESCQTDVSVVSDSEAKSGDFNYYNLP